MYVSVFPFLSLVTEKGTGNMNLDSGKANVSFVNINISMCVNDL